MQTAKVSLGFRRVAIGSTYGVKWRQVHVFQISSTTHIYIYIIYIYIYYICVYTHIYIYTHSFTDNSRMCLCTQCKSCKHSMTLHCLLVISCPQKTAFGLAPECNLLWGFWACVWWASSTNSRLQGRFQLCILIRVYNEIQPRGGKNTLYHIYIYIYIFAP